MRNLVFIVLSSLFTLYVLIDTGKLDHLLANWRESPLPTQDDLTLYASQGFYYLAMLVGVIYVVRKFRAKYNKSE
jgi:hypothetical protein